MLSAICEAVQRCSEFVTVTDYIKSRLNVTYAYLLQYTGPVNNTQVFLYIVTVILQD